MNVKCTKCGNRNANHKVIKWWEDPQEQNLCCYCHVKGGGAPADWHPECIKADAIYNKKIDKIK